MSFKFLGMGPDKPQSVEAITADLAETIGRLDKLAGDKAIEVADHNETIADVGEMRDAAAAEGARARAISERISALLAP